MGFLAAAVPAIAQGAAGAGAGALINAAVKSGSGGGNYQAPSLGITQSGGAGGSATLTDAQKAQIDEQVNASPLPPDIKDKLREKFYNDAMQKNASTPNLVMPTTGQDAINANAASQGALSQQQALVQALQGQNGLQNQTNSYNQLGNVSNQFGNLANQYQNIAAGQGPNPAQALLAQQTGNNAAQTSALMGSQRGASQNAGLLARQAGQAGANLQQQAVGQAATMQANQSLNALGQVGSAYGQQGNLAGMQGNIAGQEVGNQIGATQAQTAAQQQQQQMLLNALQGQNQTLAGQQASQTAANTEIQKGNQTAQNNLVGNLTSGLGAALGNVPKTGTTTPSNVTTPNAQGNFDYTNATLGQHYAQGGMAAGQPMSSYARSLKGLSTNVGMAHGGIVPAMVSPAEKVIPPSEVKKVAKGEKSALAAGRTVPGKGEVPGDSLKNDVVPRNLKEGSIVLPRSVTQSKKPGPAAQKFVEALLKKKPPRAA